MENLRTDLPASLNPAVVQGDTPAAKTARAALDGMYVAQGMLIDMAKQVKDKTRAARAGTPLVEGAIKRAEAAIETLTSQVAHLDATIDLKITAGKNTTRGPEIRAYFERQTSSFIALGKAFQDAGNNKTVVAEVLLGESFLSGITPDNKAALRSVAANALAGEEVAQRAETKTALDLLTKSSARFATDVGSMIRDMQSTDDSAIEAITKQGGES